MEQQDFIRLEGDRYYIAATSSYTDDRVWVLNHADTFGVFDRWGDVQPIGQEVQGIYHQDTRYLSRFQLYINGYRPLLLSSTITEENEVLTIDLTNPDMCNRPVPIRKDVIHIHRSKFIRNGALYESLSLVNYDPVEHELELAFTIGADFKDIFEVRGMQRSRWGQMLGGEAGGQRLVLRYRGLDGIERSTEIVFSTPPDFLQKNKVLYRVRLKPQQVYQISCTLVFHRSDRKIEISDLQTAHDHMIEDIRKVNARFAAITSSNEPFNHWLNRSQSDLVSLIAETPHGQYPYAGVPWYNTAFGRDGLLTAYETLWIAPELARGVLHYLARTQATREDSFRDAEPGKIFHETRGGEMAELGEVPFKLYYGTVDATPLFVALAGAYYQRTGDLDTANRLWPYIEAALNWIDTYGDVDGDGFVEYQHKSVSGLANQGWKDSLDSVSYESGELAKPPIALCEVQGYVYQARTAAVLLARALGKSELADQLEAQAAELKRRFNERFWDEALSCYVLALDGDKRPCRVKSSNAGHCLFSGIADPDKARAVAATLMSDALYSGWGIRTLAQGAPRYNPMSYHNGSIWPHDNALIALGFSRYGLQRETLRVLQGLFDATRFLSLQRLPELFCGFERRPNEGPTAYPVACSPQAWSVAAVFMLLQACLRVEIDAMAKKLVFRRPELPPYLNTLHLSNWQLGEGHCEILFTRHRRDVGINVVAKPDDWEILTIR